MKDGSLSSNLRSHPPHVEFLHQNCTPCGGMPRYQSLEHLLHDFLILGVDEVANTPIPLRKPRGCTGIIQRSIETVEDGFEFCFCGAMNEFSGLAIESNVPGCQGQRAGWATGIVAVVAREAGLMQSPTGPGRFWWDATLALVSRQGTVFPQLYIDHLIRVEKKDRWSFYDLTGCPSDLVVLIFKLTELSHQNTIAFTMKWLTFDLTPIVQIESQLRSWAHPPFATPSYDQGNLNANNVTSDGILPDEDTFHPIPRPPSLCRSMASRSSSVFLAGSETGDDEIRDLARGYCRWWGERSRYNMFHSVPVLLEDIWSGMRW
ncbi:hypothetical protein BBP40_005870 [Aspergillus hancockii]|nr:hypothetical protein BBP40_005870 [Aspergillus hancockii]